MIVSDPAAMRAMAHPARMAILEYLAEGHESTATECARVVGLSPSATSYHLRELAKAGLIEGAPSRGDGRERVWRRRSMIIDVRPGDRDQPDARKAAMDLVSIVLDQDDAQARRWFSRASEESGEWADAAGIYRVRIMATPAELTEVVERILAELRTYSANQRADMPRTARRVAVLLRVVPTDEPTPEGT
jgi:DNA-binding transcriptional ArsR family regulator